MQAHSQGVRFALTIDSVQHILSRDLSDVEKSNISAEMVALMFDGHNDGPSQAQNMRIVQLIIERLAELKDLSWIRTIHQLLEKISHLQKRLDSRFKTQSSKTLNRLHNQMEQQTWSHPQFLMREDFRDCISLMGIILKLLIQDRILEKIKRCMECSNISIQTMRENIQFLGSLINWIYFRGEEGNLKEKMLQIINDISNFLQRELYKTETSEIITIVLTFLKITQDVYQAGINFKEKLMYKLEIFNSLVKRQCIQKGLQFFNELISSDLQMVPLDSNIKDILGNIISNIFKSSATCEANKYLNIVYKCLKMFPLSTSELAKILNDKGKAPIYELLLENYGYLSKDNIRQIIQKMGTKNQLSQSQIPFLKKMWNQGQTSICQQTLKVLKIQAQKMCSSQHNIPLQASKHRNSLQQKLALIKDKIQAFVRSQKSIQSEDAKRQIQTISVSILNLCNFLSTFDQFQGEMLQQLKQINLQEFCTQSIKFFKQQGEPHILQVLVSLLNYLMQEFQQQLFPWDQILSQLCFIVFGQTSVNTYSIIKKFGCVRVKFVEKILQKPLYIDASKLSVEIMNDLLGSSCKPETQHHYQQQLQLKMNLIASILGRHSQEYKPQILQTIISYLQSLPSLEQNKLAGIIINTILMRMQGLTSQNSGGFFGYLYKFNSLTERLCSIKIISAGLSKSMYYRIFRMLDVLEANPNSAEVVISILIKIDSHINQVDMSSQNIKYLQNLSNICLPKYCYLANKLLDSKNGLLSIFRQQSLRYCQEVMVLYIQKWKNRSKFIVIDWQMRSLTLLMNEFIADGFENDRTKDAYNQIGEISLVEISKLAYCKQQKMNLSSFIQIAMPYLDDFCLSRYNFEKIGPLQGKIIMFLHYLKGYTSSVQDMERIADFVKLSQYNTAVWIFMINSGNMNKQDQIQYFWQKFINGDLKLINCIKYIIIFESNPDQFTERLNALLNSLQNLQISCLQAVWRKQIILILFQISKIEEDPFEIEYNGLLTRICLFFDKYFMPENVCKQIGKFHIEDIQTVNILIQTMHNLSKAIPISQRNIFFGSISRLLQIPALQTNPCLKMQTSPVGLTELHGNSFINVFIQLLSASNWSTQILLQGNFEPNSFCGQLQNLLIQIKYGNLPARNCFQLIRSGQISISMRKGDCGIIYNLIELFQLFQNQELASLFRCNYKRTKGCFCPKSPHEQIVLAYQFPIQPFIDEEMPPQDQEILITTSKYQVFCQYCFMALNETYLFYQMPKCMILWQEAPRNIQKPTIRHTIKFSRCSTDKQNALQRQTYNLSFLIFQQQAEYLSAMRTEQNWYLIKDDIIRTFSSLEQLLNKVEQLNCYKLIAKIYELEQTQHIMGLQFYSQSAIKHLTTVTSENSGHFTNVFTQGQVFKQIVMNTLEQYLQEGVLQLNQDQFRCEFTQFIQFYLQRYLINDHLAQLFIKFLPQIIKNIVALIHQDKSFNFDGVLCLLRSNYNQIQEFYEAFFGYLVMAIFEESYRTYNMILLQEYEKGSKENLYGKKLLKKIIDIINGPKSQSLFPFAISIILKLCDQIKIVLLSQSILDYFLQNSIVSILTIRFNHQLSSQEIDSLRLPELYRLCQTEHIQDGKVIVNMIQIIDNLLRYKYQQKIDVQTYMRERLLTPMDEKAIIQSDFVQNLMINISESPQRLKTLDSILGYFSNTNRQSQKKKLLCRIIIIFLRLVEANQQDARVKQHSIMLEFILRHTSYIQEVETLLGYQLFDTTLTIYKSGGQLKDLDLFNLINKIQSVYKIFMIYNLLKFISHTNIAQIKKTYIWRLFQLVPTVDKSHKIQQNPILLGVQLTKITSILEFINDYFKKLKGNQLFRKTQHRYNHSYMKEGQAIHLQNKSLVRKEFFKNQRIEVCIYTADMVNQDKEQKNPIKNRTYRNKGHHNILSILLVEITCFSQDYFQHLIKIKIENVCIKTFFMRDSKKACSTSRRIKVVKKFGLMNRQDNRSCQTLDDYSIMIQ